MSIDKYYGNPRECSAPSVKPFIQSHASRKVKGEVEAVFPPHYKNRITLTHSPKGYPRRLILEALHQQMLRLEEMGEEGNSRRFTCTMEVEEV